MKLKNLIIFTIAGLGLATPLVTMSAEVGELRWFGSVYMKFLDGNRRFENALYNNADTSPGEAGGDQGQGTEFELMFSDQISKQVEIGGRLKSRFNKNFWANYGGFGNQEDDERSAQYMKMRGAWARFTPGYNWLDSAHLGSSDFGMFDSFTIGKFRYIDRDNASGVILQGSALENKPLHWDLARVSLPRLFGGPQYNTGDLFAQDSAWAFQAKYEVSPSLNFGAIVENIDDQEVQTNDANLRDGQETYTRFKNEVYGLKGDYSGLEWMGISGAVYYSEFKIRDSVCDGSLNGNCRFSPTLSDNGYDTAWTLNLEFDDIIGNLSMSAQLFQIGASYQSVLAARREADVLLTEGREGTWQWGRPDYNVGNRNNGNSTAGIGYGGWNGTTQQVVSLMADNDFTDFDETAADSVIGWQGLTLVPRWGWGGWEMAAELSYIDFDTNWQACGQASKDQCKFPRQEGTHEWGLGGDTRSPYAPYQDRTMQILVLKTKTSLDFIGGLDLGARLKYIKDKDDRVTNSALLTDAYDGYPDAAGYALNPDWEALAAPDKAVTSINDDNREADFITLDLSIGNQLTRDLYGRFRYGYHYVDLVDGTTNVAPVGMGFEASNDFGYAEYLSGKHKKHVMALQFNYFLSGAEIGADVQWLTGTYEPNFKAGTGQTLQKTASGDAVITPMGNISTDEVGLRQYRMKVFVKVQF